MDMTHALTISCPSIDSMDFLDQLAQQTAEGKLAKARDLIRDALYCHHRSSKEMLEAVQGQAEVARHQWKTWWLKSVAKQAEQWKFGSASWVDENLYPQQRAPVVEVASTACVTDRRQKTNPGIAVARYDEGKAATTLSLTKPPVSASPMNPDFIDLLDDREDVELDYEDDLDDELPAPVTELQVVVARRSTSVQPPPLAQPPQQEFCQMPSALPVPKRKFETEPELPRVSKRKTGCPITWCPAAVQFRYPKGHVYAAHIPTALHLTATVEQKIAGLRFLASTWGEGSLEEFVALLNRTEWFEDLAALNLTDATRPHVEEVNRALRVADAHHSCHPISSPGMLLHWQILLGVLLHMTGQQYAALQRMHNLAGADVEQRMSQREVPVAPVVEFTSPLRSPQSESDDSVHWEVVDEVLPLMEAFDSHFHLDRLQQALEVSGRTSLDTIHERLCPVEEAQVHVSGAVANFCDPATYPDEETIQGLRTLGIRTVIGVHPKHAKRPQYAALRRLQTLVKLEDVAGVGEVGIDQSVSRKEWGAQQDLLAEILPLVEERHVLVLHCRGMDSKDSEDAFTTLLYQCVGVLSPTQRIHLHCFTGTAHNVRQWLRRFPQTYFGFTSMVSRFRTHQKEALCRVPTDRLLLETDAPYFPAAGYPLSAPIFLKVVATDVAKVREESVEEVLEVTLTNGVRLYGR